MGFYPSKATMSGLLTQRSSGSLLGCSTNIPPFVTKPNVNKRLFIGAMKWAFARSDDTVGRNYGRGQTPVIPGSGQRFGCSLISSITNQGQLHFMVFKDQFNTELFLNYLIDSLGSGDHIVT
jgi:hypothetical protein